jgi:hypothetical protein
MDWEFHPEWSVWTDHYVKPKDLVPKPACFDKLMDAASRLGNGAPVARIDMYVCGEKIYFGGLLGEAPIMKVKELSSENFVKHGGRIPAPIHSLNN